MLRLTKSAFYRAFDDKDAFSFRGAVWTAAITQFLNDHMVGPFADKLVYPVPLLTERDVAHLLIVDGAPATPGGRSFQENSA